MGRTVATLSGRSWGRDQLFIRQFSQHPLSTLWWSWRPSLASLRSKSLGGQFGQRMSTSAKTTLRQEMEDWLQESSEPDHKNIDSHSLESKLKQIVQQSGKLYRSSDMPSHSNVPGHTIARRLHDKKAPMPSYSWLSQPTTRAGTPVVRFATQGLVAFRKTLERIKLAPCVAVVHPNRTSKMLFCASNDFILACPKDHEAFQLIKQQIFSNTAILKVCLNLAAINDISRGGCEMRPIISLAKLHKVMTTNTSGSMSSNPSLNDLMTQYIASSLGSHGRNVRERPRMNDDGCNQAHALLKTFCAMDKSRMYLQPIPELPIQKT